jgi:hypothetical protein
MIPRMGRKGRNRCHASRNRKARFAAGLFTHSIMIGGVRRFALDQLQDAAKMPSARDMRPVSPLGDLPVRRRESQLGVKGGYRRQVDGTAGLPSAPEMPCAPR